MKPINGAFSILMADDDPDEGLFVQRVFEDLGFSASLRLVEDGEELLNYLSRCITCFDHPYFLFPILILLDLDMPKKNGWETLEELKKYNELKKIPVIIWSNSNDDRDRRRSIKMGADAFITKPKNYNDFILYIRTLIEIYCGNSEKAAWPGQQEANTGDVETAIYNKLSPDPVFLH